MPYRKLESIFFRVGGRHYSGTKNIEGIISKTGQILLIA